MSKKILFVASEVMPFAATGGLGDVTGSLPHAIKALSPDTDIRVILPLYSTISSEHREKMKFLRELNIFLSWRNLYCGIWYYEKDGIVYYFLDNQYYFKRPDIYGNHDDGERFAFFNAAVLQIMPFIDFYPDILHAHDWQSALSIIYLKRKYGFIGNYRNIKGIFTIHNIAYQGIYDFSILGDVFDLDTRDASLVAYNNCINLMKGAIVCADKITTVSPAYAKEIQTPDYAEGLEHILSENAYKLSGILNGIDYDYYNPKTDTVIFQNYSADTLRDKAKNKTELQKILSLPTSPEIPMLAVVSRLAEHKGINLITDAIQGLVKEKIQFVVLGKGESDYENFFISLQNNYPEKVSSLITYDRDLSKKLYAAADLFLMPSRSEPCGLAQMIASRYGAVPVTRETGGLYDSIKGYYEGEDGEVHGNGFTFRNYSCDELYERTMAALSLYKQKEKWNKLVKKVMNMDFSWSVSAEKYIELYEKC